MPWRVRLNDLLGLNQLTPHYERSKDAQCLRDNHAIVLLGERLLAVKQVASNLVYRVESVRPVKRNVFLSALVVGEALWAVGSAICVEVVANALGAVRECSAEQSLPSKLVYFEDRPRLGERADK